MSQNPTNFCDSFATDNNIAIYSNKMMVYPIESLYKRKTGPAAFRLEKEERTVAEELPSVLCDRERRKKLSIIHLRDKDNEAYHGKRSENWR